MALSHGPITQPNALYSTGLITDLDASNISSYNPTQNLMLYSNDVSKSSWDKTSYPVTVLNNATTDPFGGSAAAKITAGSGTALYFQNIDIGITKTTGKYASVYAKADTSTVFTLNCYFQNNTEVNVTFTLTGNGSLSADVAGNHFIEKIGTSGWYRCTIEVPAMIISTTLFNYRVWPAGRGLSSVGCFFYGHQLRESGNRSADTYIDTTVSASQYPTTWTDLSGSANNLTIAGLPTHTKSSGLGYFTLGPGQTTQYMIKNPFSMPANTVSFEFWATQLSSSQIYAALFGYSTTGGNDILLFFDYALSMISPVVRIDHASGGTNNSLAPQKDNSWKHYVVTSNRVTGLVTLHINGRSVISQNLATGVSFISNGALVIGQEQDSVGGTFDPNQCFAGNLSIIRIYNVILSENQIKQNFAVLGKRFGLL